MKAFPMSLSQTSVALAAIVFGAIAGLGPVLNLISVVSLKIFCFCLSFHRPV